MLTTKKNIEEYLNETIDTNIDLYILGASEFIKNYTGREFEETAEEIRYYDGNGTNQLIIDPATEITTVEVSYDGGETFEGIEDFKTYPYNSLPIFSIILDYQVFSESRKNVKITGKFGWNECIPREVIFCATAIAALLYKRKETSDITSERIGDYQVSYQAIEGISDLNNIKKLLNRYRKLT